MMNKESKNFWHYLHAFYQDMKKLEERHIVMLGIGEVHASIVDYSIRLTKEFSCFVTKALRISNLYLPGTFFVMEISFTKIPESCVRGRLYIWSDLKRNFTFRNSPNCNTKEILELSDVMKAMDYAYNMILKAALTFEYVRGLTLADNTVDYAKRFKRITGKDANFFNTMDI